MQGLTSCRSAALGQLLALGLLAAVFLPGQSVAGVASCANPDLSSDVNVDRQLSGTIYVAGNIRVQATLTVAANSQILMCPDAVIDVQDGAALVAIGTAAEPIVFEAESPAMPWGRIVFRSAVLASSTLRYVTLNDGGGDDPGLVYAPLVIDDSTAGTAFSAPVIDHVTINRSGAVGMVFHSDEIPASVTNLTINDSAAVAMVADAQSIGALSGNNSFTNNNPDRIRILDAGNGRISRSSVWRHHGVPYELTGSSTAVNADPGTGTIAEWVVEPGVHILIPEGGTIDISTRGAIKAQGTADNPIILTRIDETSGYWRHLFVNGTADSSLEHVRLSWGGGTSGDPGNAAMITKTQAGALSIANTEITNSQSSGIQVSGTGDFYLRDSLLGNNGGFGVLASSSSRKTLRNNRIVGNQLGGISQSNNVCVDAIGNFWGDSSGPADATGFPDVCNDNTLNAGTGDSVTTGVRYRPWLTSGTDITNRSRIESEPRYIIADGVTEGTVTVTLRDAQGQPLPGRTVEIQSNLGELVQPAGVTDLDGRVTATITSMETGFATLSATNLTDNDVVAGIGGVTFWQGPGDTGGLIDPNGTPYASPRLHIERPPFLVGFPMDLSVPMQNTQGVPLDVEVEYGVNLFHLGLGFSPVDTVTRTLAPGEQWDAPGFWVPTEQGHHCVQARITFSNVEAGIKGGNGFSLRRNTDQNPCEDLDATRLVPTRGGLLGVLKHFWNAYSEARKASRCLSEGLNFKGGASAQDYTLTFVPPVLTPPAYTAGGEITPDLAVSMTRISALAAELSALVTARAVTRLRLEQASRAGASSFVDVQYFNFRRYALQEGMKRLEFAVALDTHLLELAAAGIEDPVFTTVEQAEYLELLRTSGFEQSTVDYLLDSGWSQAEVDLRLQEVVRAYESQPFLPANFYGTVQQARDLAQRDGDDLVSRYGGTSNKSLLTKGNGMTVPDLDPVTYSFRVGHDRLTTETVQLVVRPLSVPIDWSYELEDRSLTLDPGEIQTTTLAVYPSGTQMPGDGVALAVEGFIDDELIGGVSLEYAVPQLLETVDGVFLDGFENP